MEVVIHVYNGRYELWLTRSAFTAGMHKSTQWVACFFSGFESWLGCIENIIHLGFSGGTEKML